MRERKTFKRAIAFLMSALMALTVLTGDVSTVKTYAEKPNDHHGGSTWTDPDASGICFAYYNVLDSYNYSKIYATDNSQRIQNHDKNTVTYTVELVDADGITVSTYDDADRTFLNSFANVSRDSDTVSMSASLFGDKSLEGYTYEGCYFYWNGTYEADTSLAYVNEFKNFKRTSRYNSEDRSSYLGYQINTDLSNLTAEQYNGYSDYSETSDCHVAYDPLGTLHVIYRENVYNVSYVKDGVTVRSVSTNNVTGTDAGIDTTKTGFTFNDWIVTSGTVGVNGKITGDVVYTAQYTKNAPTTTYVVDGTPVKTYTSTPTTNSEGATVYYASAFTGTEPTKSGKVFAGWSTDGTLKKIVADPSTMVITEDTVFTAVFTDRVKFFVLLNRDASIERSNDELKIGTYSTAEYSDGLDGSIDTEKYNAAKTKAAKNGIIDDVDSYIIKAPSDDAIDDALRAKGKDAIDDANEYIRWYVIKTEGDGIHVDGGIFKKEDVTVSANDITITYGDVLPTPSFNNSNAVTSWKIEDLSGNEISKEGNIPAGEYKIVPTVSANALGKEYKVEAAESNLTVNKKDISVSDNSVSKVYDGTALSYETVVNTPDGDLTLKFATESTNVAQNASLTYLGAYKDGEVFDTSTNYSLKLGTITGSITAKAITVKAVDNSKTYGQAADPALTVEISGNDLASEKETVANLFTATRVEGENAGTYAINVSFDKDADVLKNYSVETVAGTFTINRAEFSVTINNATVEATENVNLESHYSYAALNYKDDDLKVTYASPAGVKAANGRLNVGTYTNGITATVSYNDVNYTLTEVDPGTLTVVKKEGTSNATFYVLKPSSLKNYQEYVGVHGVSLYAWGNSSTDYIPTNTTLSFNYDFSPNKSKSEPFGYGKGSHNKDESGNDIIETIVESYFNAEALSKISVDYDEYRAGNKTGNTITLSNIDWYVLKDTGTNAWHVDGVAGTGKVNLANKITGTTLESLTYNGASQKETFGGNIALDVAKHTGYSIVPNTTVYSGDVKNVGEYTATVQVVYTSEDGYTSDPYEVTYTVNVTPANLKITADDKEVTFGDAVPEYTATEDKLYKLLGTDTLAYTYTCDYAQYSPVKADGYVISVSANDPNYNITAVDGKLTVEPYAITVSSDNPSKTYDGKGYEDEQVYDGLNNEKITVKYSTTEKDAGNHVLSTDVSQNGNYTVTVATRTLTINKMPITVEAFSDTKMYDGKGYTKTVDVSGAEGESYKVTYSTEEKNAGENYVLGVTNTFTSNYDVTIATTNTLTIKKRPIGFVSHDASKEYDGTSLSNNEITVSGNGFAENESVTFKNFKEITTVAESGAANTFEYEWSNATEANYEVAADVYGTLTITPAKGKLSVSSNDQTYVYNGYQQGKGAEAVNGLHNSDVIKIEYSTDGGETWSEDVPTLKNVGELEIDVRLSNPNYETAYGFYTVEVTPLSVSLPESAFRSLTKVYGNADPDFTSGAFKRAVLKDLVLDVDKDAVDTADLTGVETWRATGENVNGLTPYAIYMSIPVYEADEEDIENPGIELPELKLPEIELPTLEFKEITPLALTESTEETTETETTETTTTNSTQNVLLNYTLKPLDGEDNMQIGELLITRRPASITSDDQTKVEGEADPTLTTSVEGTVNGDGFSYYVWRMAGETAGRYRIVITMNGTYDNYDVRTSEGYLTITTAPVVTPVTPTVTPATPTTPTVTPVTPTPVVEEETVEETEAPENTAEITEIGDGEVALADGEGNETVEISDEAVPEAIASRCWIHWLILALTLVYALYATLRAVQNKRELDDAADTAKEQ